MNDQIRTSRETREQNIAKFLEWKNFIRRAEQVALDTPPVLDIIVSEVREMQTMVPAPI